MQVALLLVLALGIAAPQATISGQVRDKDGGVIPGATVTLTSPSQAKPIVLMTNALGQFQFPGAATGEHELSVVRSGFRTFRSKVQVGSDSVVVNVRLELGTLSESVTVRHSTGARSMPEIPANPRSADEFLDAARAYYARGRFSEAVAMIERAMELLRPGMQAAAQSGRSTVAPVAAAGGPERVGGDIREPVKVRDVRPIYPPSAAAAGATGIVIMEAVLDRSGMVRDVKVLKSAPMLDEAATTAVRQWLYRPARLNGVPVDVGMFVTITFGG